MSDYVTACCLGKQVVVIDSLKEVLKELFHVLSSKSQMKWVRASARKSCGRQDGGVAADQTNAMLAVVGTSCISLVSAADGENSLIPLRLLFIRNPLRWACE